MSGPLLSVSPSSLDFGNIIIGDVSTRLLTIFNLGNEALSISSVLISNPRFTGSFTTPFTVPAGSSYGLFFAYQPTAVLSDVATITLNGNAINSPVTVSASGRGILLPDLGGGRTILAPTGQAAGDQLGNAVSSAGDLNDDGFADVIVGSWANDSGGFDAGRAYVYLGGVTPTGTPAHILQGQAPDDNFGTSVAGPGDVNGDGHADVLVGAWGSDASATDAGRGYLYFGGPLMDGVADMVLQAPAIPHDRFGVCVAGAGDVNGDGHSDLVVGAGGTIGRVYVYFGGPSLDPIADWILTGSGGLDQFGWSVSGAGDVNGDGFDDLIAGAPHNDGGGLNAGRAYVYFGGSAPDLVPDWTLTGAAAGDRFGIDVSAAGDINGDNHDDILVGADFANGSGTGRAYVFHGGPAPDTIADLTLTGDAPFGSFGASVSSAGDVDLDGFEDLLVGAWLHDGAGMDAGRAYLFVGGPAADAMPDLVLTGQAPGDRLGISAASAGDVDGDGRADLIVGAYFNDTAGGEAGRAYVVSLATHRAPVVTAPTSVAGMTGTAISFQVSAVDPDGSSIESLTGEPLPAGATFSVNDSHSLGTFSWTPGPLQAGTYSLTFTATTSVSGSASTTIVIESSNRPPTITAPSSVAAGEGVPISFGVQATDPDEDLVTLGILNRPVGSLFVDFGNGTGTFSWTPGFGQAGSHTISFTARDAGGLDAIPKVVTIIVDNVNRGPSASSGGPYTGVVGVPVGFNGTGSSDPDGDPLTYEWSFGDLGSGVGPNPVHAYDAGGIYTVSLRVSDGTLTAVASTIATIQDIFEARAFLEGGNRTTRLQSGRASTCVQIEPVGRSYANTSVATSSIVMISPGTGSVDRITAIPDKTVLGVDRDGNGTDEITACFSKEDLRQLFDGLSGGRHIVGVTLEGDLATGGRFQADLEMDVVASGGGTSASVSPNPLNPSATLSFRITRPGPVRITIFDPSGRQVRTLLDEPMIREGYHDVRLDGSRDDGARLSSGVYFFRVATAEGTAAGRFVILK